MEKEKSSSDENNLDQNEHKIHQYNWLLEHPKVNYFRKSIITKFFIALINVRYIIREVECHCQFNNCQLSFLNLIIQFNIFQQ